MADGLIGIGLDLSAVERQLAALSGQTSEEVVKSLTRIERLTARSATRIAQATKAEAKGQREAQKAAEQAARAAERAAVEQARATEEGLKGIGKASGLLTDRMEQAAKGARLIATPAGIAAVAVAGIGAAAYGAVVAVEAVASAVVGIVRPAAGLARALQPFQAIEGFGGLPAASLASIDRAVGALDAMGRISDRLVVALGAEFAPAVEKAAFVAVKLGLAGLDLAQAWIGTHDVLREVATTLGGALASALVAPLRPLSDLVQGLAVGARALGVDVPDSALRASQALQELATAAGERLAGGALDELGRGLDMADVALGDYDERARQLIGTVVELTEKTRDHAAAQAADTAAAKAAEAAAKDYASAIDAARGALDGMTESDRLREMRDALTSSALAADLTEQQLVQVAATVDRLDARMAGLAVDAARALSEPIDELGQAADEAVAESEALVQELPRIMQSIPWDIALYRGLGQATVRAAGRAREVLSTITGGALGGVHDLASGLKALASGTEGADAAADAAIQFVTAMAKNAGPFIEELARRMPEIAEALAKAAPQIVAGMINALPELVVGLGEAFAQLGVILGRALWQTVADAIREIGTLGRAKTKTYGDTPGPVRMAGSTVARFAPGDMVVAGRSLQGLRDQLGMRAPAPQQVAVRLDVRDGPVALGLAVATSRTATRQGWGQDRSGRRSPYR